ncbi:MAG: hypothetical protein QM765_39560 [Myxococcales bacterium]
MDKTKRTRLSPARNGAVYPTLLDTKLDRRLLLGGVGAAALTLGLSCVAGAPPHYSDPDASVDAQVSASTDSGGVGPADAAVPDAQTFVGSDASGIFAADADIPDAGTEGGDS